MSDHHVLKCKQPFIKAVQDGAKTFEVRQYTAQPCGECRACRAFVSPPFDCMAPRPARDFKVGDTLRMHENCNSTAKFVITYILKDTDYPEGIKPGFCVMAIQKTTK